MGSQNIYVRTRSAASARKRENYLITNNFSQIPLLMACSQNLHQSIQMIIPSLVRSIAQPGSALVWGQGVVGSQNIYVRTRSAASARKRENYLITNNFSQIPLLVACSQDLHQSIQTIIPSLVRSIAQPGSALVWGTRGRGFKSRYSDHFVVT